MTEGVVFDLGYQPHDGPRLGRSGARRALLKDGLRRVLGLRRRARRKVLPVLLLVGGVVPGLFFTAIRVLAGELELVAFFDYANYFDYVVWWALVFIASAVGDLLIPDRVHGTMAIYASRPLTTVDYLTGRFAALSILVLVFFWLPQIVFFIGRALVSDQGILQHMVDNASIPLRTGTASLVYVIALAPIAFAISAFVSRPTIAAGATFGALVFSGMIGSALVEGGIDAGGLISLMDHAGNVKDWIMNDSTRTWIPEQAGLGVAGSALTLAVVAASAVAVVVGRYRRSVE